MKTNLLILLTACLANAPSLAALTPQTIQSPQIRAATVSRADPGATELSQRIATLRRTGDELRAAARQPAPKDLTPAQSAEAKKYNAWLMATAGRLDALANEGQRALKAGAQQEQTMGFNLQYQQLQSQMQHENRSYTAVSNIMKTKHDTVKNSISNVR